VSEPRSCIEYLPVKHEVVFFARAHISQAGFFLTSVNLTINGLFSHVLYALRPSNSFFGFHSGAPSANSRSKFHNNAPSISLSSTYVRLRPIQPRGPNEKGCAAFLISLPKRDFESGVSRKRSGMKVSGFAKLEGECAAAQEATHTEVWKQNCISEQIKSMNILTPLTSSGTTCPSMVDPPLGTVRRRPIGTGGKIRRPSSIQAFMKGRLPRMSILRSASLFTALRISSVNF
jgi:hypothetical protein